MLSVSQNHLQGMSVDDDSMSAYLLSKPPPPPPGDSRTSKTTMPIALESKQTRTNQDAASGMRSEVLDAESYRRSDPLNAALALARRSDSSNAESYLARRSDPFNAASALARRLNPSNAASALARRLDPSNAASALARRLEPSNSASALARRSDPSNAASALARRSDPSNAESYSATRPDPSNTASALVKYGFEALGMRSEAAGMSLGAAGMRAEALSLSARKLEASAVRPDAAFSLARTLEASGARSEAFGMKPKALDLVSPSTRRLDAWMARSEASGMRSNALDLVSSSTRRLDASVARSEASGMRSMALDLVSSSTSRLDASGMKSGPLGAAVARSSGASVARSEALEMRSKVAGMRSEAAGMRSKVAGMRSEAAGMRSEAAGIRSGLSEASGASAAERTLEASGAGRKLATSGMVSKASAGGRRLEARVAGRKPKAFAAGRKHPEALAAGRKPEASTPGEGTSSLSVVVRRMSAAGMVKSSLASGSWAAVGQISSSSSTAHVGSPSRNGVGRPLAPWMSSTTWMGSSLRGPTKSTSSAITSSLLKSATLSSSATMLESSSSKGTTTSSKRPKLATPMEMEDLYSMDEDVLRISDEDNTSSARSIDDNDDDTTNPPLKQIDLVLPPAKPNLKFQNILARLMLNRKLQPSVVAKVYDQVWNWHYNAMGKSKSSMLRLSMLPNSSLTSTTSVIQFDSVGGLVASAADTTLSVFDFDDLRRISCDWTYKRMERHDLLNRDFQEHSLAYLETGIPGLSTFDSPPAGEFIFPSAITGFKFNPTDNDKLALCCQKNRIVSLLDMNSPNNQIKLIGKTSLRGPAVGYDSLSFFDDGNTILTTSSDETLHVWDIRTNRSVFEALMPRHQHVTCSAQMRGTNNVVLGTSNGEVLLWNISYGTTRVNPSSTSVRAFSSSSGTRSIKVMDNLLHTCSLPDEAFAPTAVDADPCHPGRFAVRLHMGGLYVIYAGTGKVDVADLDKLNFDAATIYRSVKQQRQEIKFDNAARRKYAQCFLPGTSKYLFASEGYQGIRICDFQRKDASEYQPDFFDLPCPGKVSALAVDPMSGSVVASLSSGPTPRLHVFGMPF